MLANLEGAQQSALFFLTKQIHARMPLNLALLPETALTQAQHTLVPILQKQSARLVLFAAAVEAAR